MNNLPRIGIGFDSHRMEAGRPCRLGGVEFECEFGPVGHSDADAVLHALCDALLGAAGLDDLGTTFPDSDPEWKDADSRQFLSATMGCIEECKLAVYSCDLVVVCDYPKISPKRNQIKAFLSKELKLPLDRVNIKGKTTEGGDGERIEVTAVALLGPSGS